MASDKIAALRNLREYFKSPEYTPPKLRDMTPDRKGDDAKAETFSLDKPTFRSDKALRYSGGGNVRGYGKARGGKKCKVY
jgi:hypothetical protein